MVFLAVFFVPVSVVWLLATVTSLCPKFASGHPNVAIFGIVPCVIYCIVLAICSMKEGAGAIAAVGK